jgi:hypothetical protein
MRKYTVKAGEHFAKPYIILGSLKWKPKLVCWKVKLDESLDYEWAGADKGDWSKLCGIAYLKPSRWKNLNHWNSVMCAFRKVDGQVQLSPYYHVNDEVYYHEKTLNQSLNFAPESVRQLMPKIPVLTIDPTKEFYVLLDISYVDSAEGDLVTYNVTIEQGDKRITHTCTVRHNGALTKEINTYIGGQQTIDHDVTVHKQRAWRVQVFNATGLLDHANTEF